VSLLFSPARQMLYKAAALSGASSVLLGAFGAHALARYTQDPKALSTWQTAASYHLLHSAVMLHAATQRNALACKLLGAGIVLFSGSLYALTLTGQKWLGPVTPVGGLLLTAGWVALALAP
jgi:uncharacterized membrane protein YgdD (TMEM256/DUF423 family)